MVKEQKDNQTRRYILMRSLMDIGMGIIYIAVAVFIIVAPKMGFNSEILQPPFSYIFAGICILYGGFRIYRGVKKNYLRQ